MRRVLLATLLILAPQWAGAQSSPEAAAPRETLIFENATGQKIRQIYEECDNAPDCDWFDLLGENILEPGAAIRFNAIEQGDPAGCIRDFRAVLATEEAIRIRHVDACRTGVITFRLPAP